MLLVEQTRQLPFTYNSIATTSPTHAANAAWHELGNVGTITTTAVTGTFCGVTWRCDGFTNAVDAWRLKIGSWYVFGTLNTTSITTGTSGILYVPNGTHAVIWEFKDAGIAPTLSNFQAGIFKLKDECMVGTLGEYSGQFTVNVPTRITPLGTLATAKIHVNCYGTRQYAGTQAQCQWANIGDTLIGSVRLNIDGNQVDWTWRNQDPGGDEASCAMYEGTISCGANHTVDLTKNADTWVNISIYASPWLVGYGTHSPVNLDFPQNSTMYMMLEPLCSPDSRAIKVGKVRAVTFGTATDYYYTASGTANTTASYTYELVDPMTTQCILSGYGGCVSHIGVDVR